jgi:hypothetical protein
LLLHAKKTKNCGLGALLLKKQRQNKINNGKRHQKNKKTEAKNSFARHCLQNPMVKGLKKQKTKGPCFCMLKNKKNCGLGALLLKKQRQKASKKQKDRGEKLFC